MNTELLSVKNRAETNSKTGWTFYQKLALRSVFVFTLIAVVPASGEYLQKLFSLPWLRLRYVDVDVISNYYPWFVDDKGLGVDYAGLAVAAGISVLAGWVWSLLDKKERNYDNLYYWTQVIIRYKVAGVMFYFAFVKVFPVQMPFPSLSQINTLVGDYTPGRLFWITTGASPFYEVFSGLAELLGTVLLLFRRTVTIGALILLAVMVPVVALNIGYDAGIQVKAILILLLVIILLAENAKNLWSFFILQRNTKLEVRSAPLLREKWQRNARIILKVFFILFFLGFRGYSVGVSFFSGKSYKLPEGVSLPEWRGLYHVSTFKLNNTTLPYSPLDTIRWQNVIFERWNTISIKDGRPVQMSVDNSVRKTEVHANGGRHYYEYSADTLQHRLILHDRKDTARKLLLTYRISTDSTIILEGTNENSDAVYAELKKIDRIYPLTEKKGNFVYTPY